MDIRDALFQEIYDLAKEDERIVVLTADADAFVIRKFAEEFPDRFYNMGVAEQNTICFAAGLAMGGKRVFIYSIASFITARCYEQIKVNICSMNLPVTIIGLGAGLSFSHDGPTHHAIHDIGIMRMLPEMNIFNPSDEEMAQVNVTLAYLNEHPNYIRLDKGAYPRLEYTNHFGGFRIVKGLSKKLNIITTGTMVHRVLSAVEGLNVGVIDVYQLKPFDSASIGELVEYDGIQTLVVEEHSAVGGLGELVKLSATDSSSISYMSLPHKQLFDYGERDWLLSKYGLSEKHIRDTVEGIL